MRKSFKVHLIISEDYFIISKPNWYFRRIAYQEASQTFGVIAMRMDLQDSNGQTPSRPSASTHAAMMTSSSSGKMVTTGTSTMGEHTYGDEVEVHSLLVIDQHTFEGKIITTSSC